MRNRTSITLAEGDRHRLETIAAGRNTSQNHVWRARIVLLSASGRQLNSSRDLKMKSPRNTMQIGCRPFA